MAGHPFSESSGFFCLGIMIFAVPRSFETKLSGWDSRGPLLLFALAAGTSKLWGITVAAPK